MKNEKLLWGEKSDLCAQTDKQINPQSTLVYLLVDSVSCHWSFTKHEYWLEIFIYCKERGLSGQIEDGWMDDEWVKVTFSNAEIHTNIKQNNMNWMFSLWCLEKMSSDKWRTHMCTLWVQRWCGLGHVSLGGCTHMQKNSLIDVVESIMFIFPNKGAALPRLVCDSPWTVLLLASKVLI